MEKKYIMSLDQGTSSCRAIIFDCKGSIVRKAQREFTQFFPQAGWVEHDAEEIWRVQKQVMLEAAEGLAVSEIAGIGIANQRETTVIWDRVTGKPLSRAIVWQCRRSSEICDELRKEGREEEIHAKTGLLIDPYFSATKLMWLLQHVPGLRSRAVNGEVLFGTIDSWLIWNLTAGQRHVTDYSNASRTMMFNIHTLKWDKEILQHFGIPLAMLPEVCSSSEIYGETTLLGGQAPIPVAGAAGDQQAALFGQGCYRAGMAKNTYGTGCFLLSQTGERPVMSNKGLLTTIAWGLNGKIEYALEGSVFTAGSVIRWLRDGLGLISRADETEAIAESVGDTQGVYFVPAFTGLATPYWNPDARGMITGLSRGAGKDHIIRAALEAIAYQSADVLNVMEEQSGLILNELRVDGGATANRFLMQFQADLLGVPVIRSKLQESTALGAAYLAGLAVGFWSSKAQIEELWESDMTFVPQMGENDRVSKYEGWKKAVAYQL